MNASSLILKALNESNRIKNRRSLLSTDRQWRSCVHKKEGLDTVSRHRKTFAARAKKGRHGDVRSLITCETNPARQSRRDEKARELGQIVCNCNRSDALSRFLRLSRWFCTLTLASSLSLSSSNFRDITAVSAVADLSLPVPRRSTARDARDKRSAISQFFFFFYFCFSFRAKSFPWQDEGMLYWIG